MSERHIERLTKLLNHNINCVNGSLTYGRIQEALRILCEKIEELEDTENVWYLDDLTDILIGSFWHFTEWHGGQSSDTYLTLCFLGRIFSPGMSCGPEDDSGEKMVYDNLETMAQM